MAALDPGIKNSASAVVAAYKRYAERIRDRGYRGLWSYVATKALSDRPLPADLDMWDVQILNVGCSEPIDELFFARRQVRRSVSLDQSQEMLTAAAEILRQELAPQLIRRIAPCAANAAQLPFADGALDIVVSFSMLEYIPDPDARRRAFAEVARVTRVRATSSSQPRTDVGSCTSAIERTWRRDPRTTPTPTCTARVSSASSWSRWGAPLSGSSPSSGS